MNPRQMKQAMKKMGIKTEELSGVEEVIIRTSDKEYVVTGASVTLMTVQGQSNYQVVGETEIRPRGESGEPAAPSVPDEDVQLVMSQTGCDEATAKDALLSVGGQPAEAIIRIMSQ